VRDAGRSSTGFQLQVPPADKISFSHSLPFLLPLHRYTALSSKAPIAAANSAAEEAVIHTLTHGMAKCTTTVAFHEEFEDV